MFITTGVFAASSVAFTVLIGLGKGQSGKTAALQKRGLHFGAAPTRDGGFMLGGGEKF